MRSLLQGSPLPVKASVLVAGAAVLIAVVALRRAGDRADTAIAARDSAVVQLMIEEAQHDSVRSLADGTYLKLAQQRSISDHAEADALHWRRIAATLTARLTMDSGNGAAVDTLIIPRLAPGSDSIVGRSARWSVYDAPLHLQAQAYLEGRRADFTYQWQLDPASIQVRVGCVAAAGSLQRAEVALNTPPWMKVAALDSVMTDLAVCNPPRARPRRHWLEVPAGAVAGALVAYLSNHSLWDGAAIGLGVGLSMHFTFRGN